MFQNTELVPCSVISSYLLGDPPTPQNPKSPPSPPPRKTPKIQKNIKDASNLPPGYVSPQNLESRINIDTL